MWVQVLSRAGLHTVLGLKTDQRQQEQKVNLMREAQVPLSPPHRHLAPHTGIQQQLHYTLLWGLLNAAPYRPLGSRGSSCSGEASNRLESPSSRKLLQK